MVTSSVKAKFKLKHTNFHFFILTIPYFFHCCPYKYIYFYFYPFKMLVLFFYLFINKNEKNHKLQRLKNVFKSLSYLNAAYHRWNTNKLYNYCRYTFEAHFVIHTKKSHTRFKARGCTSCEQKSNYSHHQSRV